MKYISTIVLCIFLMVTVAFTQTTAPTQPTSPLNISFNLSQITLPGAGKSLTGAEADALFPVTPNNYFGETNLASSGYSLFGGRYDRNFPQLTTFLNNLSSSPILNFQNSQVGLTGTLGVVNAGGGSHWGERAGVFWRQYVSSSWAVNFEAQWTNLPGYAHNTYSLTLGPSIQF